MIARSLGRSAGTVSDEVNRNGGAATYEAGAAEDRAAAKRETTRRKARMSRDGAVFTEVTRLLGLGWSLEQISGRRKREDAGMQQESGLRVSHEAIYAAPMACATRNTSNSKSSPQACPHCKIPQKSPTKKREEPDLNSGDKVYH